MPMTGWEHLKSCRVGISLQLWIKTAVCVAAHSLCSITLFGFGRNSSILAKDLLFGLKRDGRWSFHLYCLSDNPGDSSARFELQQDTLPSEEQGQMNTGVSPSKARAGTTTQLYKRWSPPSWVVFEKLKSKQICLVKKHSSVTSIGKSKGRKAPNFELQEIMNSSCQLSFSL